MKRPSLTLILVLLSFQFLSALENYPAGARSLALSNAFVSISDIWSTFHNQASLPGIEQFSAGIFYESRYLVDELSLTAGTIVLPVKPGVFGFSFYQFGESTYKENKLGVAFAKQLSRKLQLGIQLDYFSKRLPENKNVFGMATFETGLIYSPTKDLFLGLHIFNPISYETEQAKEVFYVPTPFRFGGHYQFDDMVLLTVETQKDLENPFRIKTGIEFLPLKNLALRFGVSGKPISYSAGIGITYRKVTTDIGFTYHGNLGPTPAISIQFNL